MTTKPSPEEIATQAADECLGLGVEDSSVIGEYIVKALTDAGKVIVDEGERERAIAIALSFRSVDVAKWFEKEIAMLNPKTEAERAFVDGLRRAKAGLRDLFQAMTQQDTTP